MVQLLKNYVIARVFSLAPPARAGVILPEAIHINRRLLRPDKNIRDGIGKSILLAKTTRRI
jgi:hypothetical protein